MLTVLVVELRLAISLFQLLNCQSLFAIAVMMITSPSEYLCSPAVGLVVPFPLTAIVSVVVVVIVVIIEGVVSGVFR